MTSRAQKLHCVNFSPTERGLRTNEYYEVVCKGPQYEAMQESSKVARVSCSVRENANRDHRFLGKLPFNNHEDSKTDDADYQRSQDSGGPPGVRCSSRCHTV